MSYLTIENFKYGRDTRRSELTTRPGALARCQDAHINQGGEIESRQRFSLYSGAQTGPTFGYQEVADAVLIFGSVANATAFAAYPSVTAASGNIPASAYRRLIDPLGASAMTSVIASCAINGKDFVIAEFAGGGTPTRFAFYNGVAIADSYRGIVLAPDLTTGSIAWTLYAAIQNDLSPALGFGLTAPPVPLTTGTKTFHIGNLNPFTCSVSKTSAAGTITQTVISAVSPYQVDVTVDGTWAAGDLYGLTLTINGISYNVGSGNLTGRQMTYCYTFGKRVWILSGTKALCSEIDKPWSFNGLDGIGNGFVDLAADIGPGEVLTGCAHYQGKLAFFSRRYVVIWHVPSDPSQWQRLQVLENTGNLAALAPRPLGDLDILYLSDTGVRSLRVRDASLNASVADVGAPIDIAIQSSLVAGTATSNAAACAIVEPISNRYWLHLNGVIHIFSYVTSEKINAWATYTPSYQTANQNRIVNDTAGTWDIALSNVAGPTLANAETTYLALAPAATITLPDRSYKYYSIYQIPSQGSGLLQANVAPDDFRGSFAINGGGVFTSNQTAFTPEKFITFLGRVYVRSTTGLLFLVGSLTTSQYDNIPAIWEAPWLAAQTPGTLKDSISWDACIKNAWALYAGMSPSSGPLALSYIGAKGSAASPSFLGDSTFEAPVIPYANSGTHVKIKGISGFAVGDVYGQAATSSVLWHYLTESEKI